MILRILLFFLLATQVATADMLSVLLALEKVESSGNASAYRPETDAVGPLQITPVVVRDVNQIAGYTRYSLSDRWDRRKSREMAIIYLRHYCSPERLGRNPTAQDYAMVWSKGPQGVWLPKWENHHYTEAFHGYHAGQH